MQTREYALITYQMDKFHRSWKEESLGKYHVLAGRLVEEPNMTPNMTIFRPVVTGVRPRSKSCCKRFSTDESVMTGDRRSRQMKVRFADQPNTPVTPVTPVIARKPQLPINTNSLARRLGQFADPPSKPPPPYEVACQKLRQLDINKTTLPSTTSRGYYYTLAESQAELQQEIISKPSISNTKSMEELCTAKVKRTNSRLGLTEATVASARLSTFLYDSQETIVAELQSFSQIPQTPRQETIR